MVERFLRYSLEHGRKIAVILQDENGLRRVNLTVTRIEADEISYVSSRGSKEKTLPRDDILSASYARGDDGDTLRSKAE